MLHDSQNDIDAHAAQLAHTPVEAKQHPAPQHIINRPTVLRHLPHQPAALASSAEQAVCDTRHRRQQQKADGRSPCSWTHTSAASRATAGITQHALHERRCGRHLPPTDRNAHGQHRSVGRREEDQRAAARRERIGARRKTCARGWAGVSISKSSAIVVPENRCDPPELPTALMYLKKIFETVCPNRADAMVGECGLTLSRSAPINLH